jgi:tetratricopeptide (TPR) repeat protein
MWHAAFLLLPMFLYSCASPPSPKETITGGFHVLPETYRSRALEYEKQNEWPKALQSWKIVLQFRPNYDEARQKIADIEALLDDVSEKHFQQGLSYYKKNSFAKARKEFLLALSYDPDNRQALDFVKQKVTGEDYIWYEVKRGDTVETIARELYNDAEKDFLIAYFNDLGRDDQPRPGTVLQLPVVEKELSIRPTTAKEAPVEMMEVREVLPEAVPSREMLGKAVTFFEKKQYQETLTIAEEIFEHDPFNKEARHLINASYYEMGKTLISGEEYHDALAMLDHVDPDYQDVSQMITSLKKSLAKKHYTKGIEFFINEELAKAIKEWQETLKLDPDHPKARDDIENAQSLLDRLNQVR